MEKERRSASLAEAIKSAVDDIRSTVAALDIETLGTELEKRIHWYWGYDHNISHNEIMATARDLKEDTANTDQAFRAGVSRDHDPKSGDPSPGR